VVTIGIYFSAAHKMLFVCCVLTNSLKQFQLQVFMYKLKISSMY